MVDGNPSCVCMKAEKNGLPYVRWMAEYFGDCAYSSSEQWAFYLGLASLCVWIVAQSPQIFKTFKLKQVDGISGTFLAAWLSGDLTNLLGCITSAAFKTQLFSAIYFCAIDIILLAQYAYYRYIYPAPPTPLEDVSQDQKGSKGSEIADERAVSESKSVTVAKRIGLIASIVVAAGLLIGLVVWNSYRATGNGNVNELGIPYCDPEIVPPTWEHILGIIFSWASGSLYFFCRVPQLVQNFERKSVHGLSIVMFALAITANLCYGGSIIFKLPKIDAEFWEVRFPYLFGSLGTLVFDVIIMVQAYMYGVSPPPEEEDSTTLVEMEKI